jgi:hypothetical protein
MPFMHSQFYNASILLLLAVVACGDDNELVEPEPIVLATLPSKLESIVLSPSHVYTALRRNDLSNGSGVYAVAKIGGTVQTIYETGFSNYIRLIGADSTSVYWVEYESTVKVVKVADLGGGPPRRLVTLASQVGALNAAIDKTHVYYGRNDFSTKTARIERIAKQGGTAELLGDAPYGLRGLLVDSTSVFGYSDGLSLGAGTVWKIAKAGGNVETLANADAASTSSDVQTVAFAADDNHLYYLTRDYNNSGISKVAKAGGAQLVVRAVSCRDSLAVSDTDVYWPCNTGPDNQIYRADKNGGGASEVNGSTRIADEVAVDDSHLFWLTNTSIVMKGI